MVPRVAAVVLGAVAGIAATLVFALDWNSAVALLGIDKPAILAVLADALPRLAWIASVAISTFAAVSLLIALVAGFAEILVARARIDALRHDPALVGRWNAADWRAAFAHTAIRERAEAAVSALLPVAGAPSEAGERRAIADPQVLIDLDRIWLERLALDRVIGPLPSLLLGVGATAALLRYASGEPGWEITLTAGVAGWLLVRTVHYLVRLVLGPLIALAVGAATAAVRPLTSALSLELIAWRTSDDRRPVVRPPFALEPPAAEPTLIETAEPFFEPAVLTEPAGEPAPGSIAAIAGKLGSIVQRRDEAIESVLAEVRAGIEELLAVPQAGGQAHELVDAVRSALADQGEALRHAGAELRGGIEAVAGSLQATLGSIEATERRNLELMAELLRVMESSAGQSGIVAGKGSAPSEAGSNAEIAGALRNLLREFDES